MVCGGSQAVISMAVKYALERQQFGQPIASFGAIRHKLAEMAIRTFAVQSALYRVRPDPGLEGSPCGGWKIICGSHPAGCGRICH